MSNNIKAFAPLKKGGNVAALKLIQKPTNEWLPITPVPYVVRKKTPPHKLGVPSATWDYVDEAGGLLGAIARFDTPNGKELRPLAYCEKDGVREWRWQAMPVPRPLFCLHHMAQNPTLPVLVVEGEKAAVAAQALLPGYIVTTSPGGAQASAKASWEYLKDRVVTIWPDNHKEGMDYAVAVSKLVLDVGVKSVAIVEVPTDFPLKWDLADPLPTGWDLDGIKALISSALIKYVIISSAAGSVAAKPTFINGTDIEMANQLHVDLIKQYGGVVTSEGWVWHYTGTHWKALSESELRRVVHSYDGTEYGKTGVIKLGKTRINSILNEFMHMHEDIDFFAKTPIGINCLSGFICFPPNGGDPVLEKHAPEHRCRHVIQGSWHVKLPGGHHEKSKLLYMLHGCFKGDVDAFYKIALLGEVAGAAALGYGTRTMKPKAIILKGETAENGKSQVLDIIRGLLPDNAISAIPLGKFGDEKYVHGLAGKLLNASDELTSAASIASDAFKKIITGESTTARNVFSSITTFRPQAQHVFATNDLPSFKSGMDCGVQRRLLVLPFNRTIPESERIENIGEFIVKNEIDLLLRWAVNGAQRLLNQRGFTELSSSKAALREWMYGADPVLAWLDQATVLDPSVKTPPRDAFLAFKAWAVAEGYKENTLPAINNFSAHVLRSGKGITKEKTNKGRALVGLAIKGGV